MLGIIQLAQPAGELTNFLLFSFNSHNGPFTILMFNALSTEQKRKDRDEYDFRNCSVFSRGHRRFIGCTVTQ